jgi:L-amino acid N-acyltransferase YncA
MIVRHASAARDAGHCAAIYAPFVSEGVASFEERAPSPEEMAARIESVSLTHPWLVAADPDTAIGFAYAAEHRQRAAYRWAADVTVYVSPAHHGRGAGRALYRALLDLLARQGIQVACAGITLPNQPSVALHESFGFQLVGVYRRIGWKAGAWRDVGWWALELVAPEAGGPPVEPGPPARLEEL